MKRVALVIAFGLVSLHQANAQAAKTPVAAVAYRPDGKLLAAGGREEVLFFDPANGDLVGKLTGQTTRVTALAFARDGKRLAVASGKSAQAGEVRLYAVPANGMPEDKGVRLPNAHTDLVYDLVFSPDSKILATCSYDRTIKLWNVADGKELHALKDHSDSIYGIAFSPDGKLLASGAADRAVKVWDVASGNRLYTLADATDWVYAVAWSPDGKHLAAAGIDKSIRVWEVNADGGKLIHSVFAHEGPVTRLVYAADGKTLYSLGEDRAVKAWDATKMAEPKVYAKQSDTPLSLAVRPDGKQLAIGRFDGALVLLDEASGKVQAQPMPVKPKPPALGKLTPNAGQRGQTIRLILEGKEFDAATEIVVEHPGVEAKIIRDSQTPMQLKADLAFPKNTPAGAYPLRLKNGIGASAALPFIVDLFPPTAKQDQNNSPRTGQPISLPTTIVGAIKQAGDVDWYRFEAKAGQQVGVQALTTVLGSKIEAVLQLVDSQGRLLAEGTGGVLGHTCEKAGTYALGIRDRDYRGGADLTYRLQVGEVPVVTAVFPLGVQRGQEADIKLEGVFLGDVRSVKVKAPADAAIGSRLPLPVSTPLGAALGNPSVIVGEFPEITAAGSQMKFASIPATADGRIERPGAVDVWRFSTKKGQTLIVEVSARRAGSPLDSTIEILDSKGQIVPQATLRCVAKTYTTFRDHDSVSPGIRIDSWNELGINDYLYVDNTLIRIKALPRNPDDDCQFFSVNGQRVGYLGTTPTHHSNGTPMYKVQIHPPGTTFSPNGFPVFAIPYRNDDGGPGYGKDSLLFFEPPADGEYQVRLGDAGGQGSKSHGYRLTIRPPRPSFEVRFNPTAPAVWKGGAIPVTVTADRSDGFDGDITVRLENLPPGFSAPTTTIPAGEHTTAFALYADANTTIPAKQPALKLVASAKIDGKDLIREVTGGAPKVVEPGDIVTTAQQSEVTLRPGGETKLTVTIERRNGFNGRVPLDVRGLPHGVRVLDIGLNGILITEKETTRTFVLYAEPWVQPTEHPIVVLARREGKNTEHAAKSVLLKVAK